MTPELTAALSKAKTLAEVEDIYRPYKPKRKTRASIAKARGLQPLADAILQQDAAFDPQDVYKRQILTSSASGSCRRRAIDTALRRFTSNCGNSSAASLLAE